MEAYYSWMESIKVGDMVRAGKDLSGYGVEMKPGIHYKVIAVNRDSLNRQDLCAFQLYIPGFGHWWVENYNLLPLSKCYRCVFECKNDKLCELFTEETDREKQGGMK